MVIKQWKRMMITMPDTQHQKKKNKTTKQHEIKWNGNKAMKKNDDNHARAVTFPVRIADVRCRSNCTIARVSLVQFFEVGFFEKSWVFIKYIMKSIFSKSWVFDKSCQKVHNKKVFFEKTECLTSTYKSCSLRDKLPKRTMYI